MPGRQVHNPGLYGRAPVPDSGQLRRVVCEDSLLVEGQGQAGEEPGVKGVQLFVVDELKRVKKIRNAFLQLFFHRAAEMGNRLCGEVHVDLEKK